MFLLMSGGEGHFVTTRSWPVQQINVTGVLLLGIIMLHGHTEYYQMHITGMSIGWELYSQSAASVTKAPCSFK